MVFIKATYSHNQKAYKPLLQTFSSKKKKSLEMLKMIILTCGTKIDRNLSKCHIYMFNFCFIFYTKYKVKKNIFNNFLVNLFG